MDHKLHLTERLDATAKHLNVEASGCLTQDNYPDLLHTLRAGARIAGKGGSLVLDLTGATHLDPDALLALRRMASHSAEKRAASGELDAQEYRLTLVEPPELPICLMHVGADGEVLARLDAATGDSSHAAGCSFSPCAQERKAAEVVGFAEIYEGTLDPGATVRALSDHSLEQLTDMLYRYLDAPDPTYAAQTWFELATEELQNRGNRQPRPPHPGLPGGHARLARDEAPG